MSQGSLPLSHHARTDDLSGTRVLLVDDDPESLRLLEVVLKRMGVGEVRCASDPMLLEAEWQGHHPDLVLMDWHMPGRAGPEALALIRSYLDEGEFVPIVILTSDATKEARDAALAGGADDFLVKPFDIAEGRLRVRNLLRARELHVRVET